MRNSILGLAAIVVGAGCGGGGSTGSSSALVAGPLPPVTNPASYSGPIPPLPNTIMRTYVAGDTWQYALTGNVQIVDEKNPTRNLYASVTGTMTRQITQENLLGTVYLKITDAYVYTPKGSTPMNYVSETYILEDVEKQVTWQATNHDQVLMGITTNSYTIPGTWSAATGASGRWHFDSIDPELTSNDDGSEQFTVAAKERVNSGVGFYDAWKTAYSKSHEVNYSYIANLIPNGTVLSGTLFRYDEDVTATQWWAPQIGAFAAEDVLNHITNLRIDSPGTVTNGVVSGTTFYHELVTQNFHLVLRSMNLS